jgi:hypothetical protein
MKNIPPLRWNRSAPLMQDRAPVIAVIGEPWLNLQSDGAKGKRVRMRMKRVRMRMSIFDLNAEMVDWEMTTWRSISEVPNGGKIEAALRSAN